MSPRSVMPSRRSGENGFTLIEMLVTMSLAFVVLAAAFQGAQLFTNTTKRAGDTVQSQDTARATVRTLVSVLRQARLPQGATTPVLRAVTSPSSPDIVFASRSSAGAPTWTRLCVTADGRSLLRGYLSTPTYAAPATSCSASDTTGGWTYGAMVSGTLRDGGTLLSFDSGSCVGGLAVAGTSTPTPGAACVATAATVTTVGIRLAIAGRSADSTSSTVVTDAVNLRNGAIS